MAASKKLNPQTTLETYLKNGKNIRATARELGVHRRTIDRHLEVVGGNKNEKPIIQGILHAPDYPEYPVPPKGKVNRYIFTCAQNNTYIHEEFWNNLLAFAQHHEAKLHVSRFAYNINSHQNSKKPGTGGKAFDGLFYDPRLVPYFSDERIIVAPGLVWCGELCIQPTAARPLSAFDAFTGRASGIFPHTKVAMESIPRMPGEPPKFNYTTGCVTLKNYIQMKAGLKAEFHHIWGALLVEVDSDGDWFVRQLNATTDGSFYDLDCFVKDGKVTTGHNVEAIQWGDVHVESMDAMVYDLAWGHKGAYDTLKPRYQFMHDLFDMRNRNHHDMDNCHLMFQKFVEENENVENEVCNAASFLKEVVRDWSTTLVVDSNHDAALEKWLREANYKTDPVNAEFFLRAQARKYKALKDRDYNFHLLEWVLRDYDCPKEVQFLRPDESFVICADSGGGIECGIHGHHGANGSRGRTAGFVKLGRKANVGHTHQACIIDGVYCPGTCTGLRLSYTRGPTSWSWTHLITYRNGKRCLFTMRNGKWRA